jgi:hypothetical protein
MCFKLIGFVKGVEGTEIVGIFFWNICIWLFVNLKIEYLIVKKKKK